MVVGPKPVSERSSSGMSARRGGRSTGRARGSARTLGRTGFWSAVRPEGGAAAERGHGDAPGHAAHLDHQGAEVLQDLRGQRVRERLADEARAEPLRGRRRQLNRFLPHGADHRVVGGAPAAGLRGVSRRFPQPEQAVVGGAAAHQHELADRVADRRRGEARRGQRRGQRLALRRHAGAEQHSLRLSRAA